MLMLSYKKNWLFMQGLQTVKASKKNIKYNKTLENCLELESTFIFNPKACYTR